MYEPEITPSQPAPDCRFAKVELSQELEAPMSNSFLNWTSRAAIAGRIAEHRRPHDADELTTLGDYHPPFAKVDAGTKAAKWLWQVYII